MPWLRNKSPTEVNFYFERQSGSPISYTASPDLNGDGFAGNDPIYVPKSATDPNEIKIGTMTRGRRVHAGCRRSRGLRQVHQQPGVPERAARTHHEAQ